MLKKINFKITNSLFFLLLIFLSGICVLLSEFMTEFSVAVLFSITYIITLILLVFYCNSNPISSIYSVGLLLYFYQVPLVELFQYSKVEVYSLSINNETSAKYYNFYSIILFFNIIACSIFKKSFEKWELTIYKIDRNKYKLVSYILILISAVSLIYTLEKVGGFRSFLALNKFESVQEAKIFMFFTWREFIILAMSSYIILARGKNKLIYSIFIFFMIIELLTAKRLLTLIFIISIYVSFYKKMSINNLIIMFLAILIMNLLKYIYYPIKGLVLGTNSINDVFWFSPSEFLTNSLLIGEFSAHLRLSYLYFYHKINFSHIDFINFLGNLLPLSSQYIKPHITAGEFLRIYLNEGWSGLASSLYIFPFTSAGYLGIVAIYSLYLLIIITWFKIAQKSEVLLLSFIATIPISLFYIQREELLVIPMNLYIYTTLSVILLSTLRILKYASK